DIAQAVGRLPALQERFLSGVEGVVAVAQHEPERAHQLIAQLIEDAHQLLQRSLRSIGTRRGCARHVQAKLTHAFIQEDAAKCHLDWSSLKEFHHKGRKSTKEKCVRVTSLGMMYSKKSRARSESSSAVKRERYSHLAAELAPRGTSP